MRRASAEWLHERQRIRAGALVAEGSGAAALLELHRASELGVEGGEGGGLPRKRGGYNIMYIVFKKTHIK